MLIMVSGPYRSGSDDPVVWRTNLMAMNLVALELHRMGHIPVVGVNMALPMIEAGGGKYDEIMMPYCLELAERCDAVLRTGGESKGADEEMQVFIDKGLPVYYSLGEIPVLK